MRDFAEPRRLARFVVVGLASTALYFALLLLLADTGLPVWLLTTACYAASMVFNYIAQARYTFRARAGWSGVIRYMVMHAAAMTFNATAMTILTGRGWHLFAAQVLVTGIVTAGTFLLSRHWVFAGTRVPRSEPVEQ